MKLSTSKLIKHLRNLVGDDKVSKAIDKLEEITTDKHDFQDDLLLIKKRYKNLYKKEVSGLGDEHDTRNRITRDFLKLLTYIKTNNPRGIEVLKSNYVLTNLEDAILKSSQTRTSKVKKKKFLKGKKINIKYLILVFTLLFVILISFLFSKNKKSNSIPFSSKTNIESDKTKKAVKKDTYRKILNDRLSESKKSEKIWAIKLATYKTYKEAYKQAVVYQARKISVFKKKVNNNTDLYYALIFPFESEEAAKKKLTKTTKSTWPNAEVIKINDSCNKMKIDKKLNCIECF